MNKGVKFTAYIFIAIFSLTACRGERKRSVVSAPEICRRTFINGTGKVLSSIVILPDKSKGICLMFPVELPDRASVVLPIPCELKNGKSDVAVTFKGIMKTFLTETDICILDNPDGSTFLIKMKGKKSTVPFFSRRIAIALAVLAFGASCICFVYTKRRGGLIRLICPIGLLAGGFMVGWTIPSAVIPVILAGLTIGTVCLILYLVNLYIKSQTIISGV